MNNLLNNEELKQEITVGIETFSITDKRLIYTNTNNVNGFVGLNELRGGNVLEVSNTYNKFNLFDAQALILLSYLAVFVTVFIVDSALGDDMVSSILSALAYGFVGAITIPILLKIAQSVTTQTVQEVNFVIEKTDDSYYLNQNYHLSFKDDLLNLSKEINQSIYK